MYIYIARMHKTDLLAYTERPQHHKRLVQFVIFIEILHFFPLKQYTFHFCIYRPNNCIKSILYYCAKFHYEYFYLPE